MERERFLNLLEDCPVIAAVKDEKGLAKSLKTECSIVFVLMGDLCDIGSIVQRIKAAGKMVFVHLDLVNGLSNKEISVDFIRRNTAADGIITTKPALVKRARELGLYAILRFFVFDSISYANVEKQSMVSRPDAVEVMPGVMPKLIGQLVRVLPMPVIASGLIKDKDDVMQALSAGAVSISATNEAVWFE